MERPHKMALLLNSEIAGVVTAMRLNSKWALVPMRYQVRRSSHYLKWAAPPPRAPSLLRPSEEAFHDARLSINTAVIMLTRHHTPQERRSLRCRTMRSLTTHCWTISVCFVDGSSGNMVSASPMPPASTPLPSTSHLPHG